MWLTHMLSDASHSRQNGKVRTAKIKLLFASGAIDDLKRRGSEHSAKKTRSAERTQKYDNWFRFGSYRPILQSHTRILHICTTHISTTLYRCHESQSSVYIPRISEVQTVTVKFSVDLGSGLRNETRYQMATSEKKAMQWYRIMFLTRSVCFSDRRRECYGTLPTKCRWAAFSCVNDVSNVYSIQEDPLPTSKRTHSKIILHQNSLCFFQLKSLYPADSKHLNS